MDLSSLVSVFTWTPELDRLYRRLIPGTGRTVVEVAETLRIAPDDLREQMATLVDRGLVEVDEADVLTVAEPGAAVTHMISAQGALMSAMSDQLRLITSTLPALLDAGPYAARHESDRVAGEVVDGTDPASLLTEWVRTSTGSISILRPGRAEIPGESALMQAVDEAIAQGRVVRSVHETSVLSEVPGMLEERVALGEQVRVVPHLLTRMAIVGDWRVLVPEPLGVGSARRVVLRQPAVVQLCQAWFDLLWERGTPVLDPRAAQDRRQRRTVLLAQLANGVKDEQIARNLDVSLRTVRRAVADLLDELGVETRFQAGVEAARRGWL